ncbi:MAG TPA: acyltransferase family protein, partial [Sphingomonas sp.]
MEKRRFVVLDGMRGLAALSVVALHTAQYFPSQTGPARAYLAVDFFFMLSGFVMAHAYGDKLRAGLTIKGFAEIRLARLYPMIFLGVTLGLLARVCAPDGSGAGLLATLGAAIFAYLILPTPRL